MRGTGLLVLLVAGLVWWGWPSPVRERVVRDAPEPVVPAADSGKPPDPPESARPETALQPAADEPLERGDCALELHLQDADTGEAVSGVVRLYRLDVPGNEHWTRGDQLQAELDVPVEGTTIAKLPAGFYRPHCPSQRFPATDHESFEIAGARTKQVVRVPMPRSFEAWMVVRDENGRALERGDLTGISLGSSMRSSDPQWLRPRVPMFPNEIGLGGGAGGSRRRSGTRRLGAVGPNGRYRLNAYTEDDCRLHRRVLWRWRSAARSEVRALLDLECWRETTFFGASVPLEPIRKAVLLPSGQRAVEAGAELSAWCDARRDDTPLEIDVRVTLEGYADLAFAFAPGGQLPGRTMIAKP